MNIRIGTAPDSWGIWFASDTKQPPWSRFLDEVAEAGYEWVELGPYGYLPTDIGILRRELEQRSLKVAGTFIMRHLEEASLWPEIEKEAQMVSELLAAFNAEFFVLIDNTYTDLVTGEPLAPAQLDEDGWKELIETTNKVVDLTAKFGLKLAFHPHANTHVEYEAQIEKFLNDTDPDRVSLCFDTGHHAFHGTDCVAFMRKHHKRIPYIHIKSVDRNIREKVEAENIPFAKAVAMDMFCEPSEGMVDFIAMRDLLREIDFDGWAVVEQDMYPAPFDKPLPIAKHTRNYLREIGLG